MTRAVITGMGLICGNAKNKAEFAEALFSGKSGIKKCRAFPTDDLSTSYFGEIDDFPKENLPKTDRLRLIFDHCIEELLADAMLCKEDLTAMGSHCRTFWGTLIYNNDWFLEHCKKKRAGIIGDSFIARSNEYTTYLRNLTGACGKATVVSSACASGTTAVGMAVRAIKAGLCEAAVAGGADALSCVTAYGFNSLKALSGHVCKPFTMGRDGINIGEAGAFFFIESLEHAKARGAKIYAEIVGSAINNDAYHITSLQPDGIGAAKIMVAALQDAGLTVQDIDYINAHGTGTQTNDAAEMKAVSQVFGANERPVYFSTTKALLGHCMGASGAIELAAVILAIKAGKYLPMPSFDKAELILGAANIKITDEAVNLDINYALSTSFAFSGNNAAVILKKYAGGGDV